MNTTTAPMTMGESTTTVTVATPANMAFGGRNAKHRVARRAPRTSDGLSAADREALVAAARAKQAVVLAGFDASAKAAS